jgi:signal transduction histidine kinase
MVRFGFFLLAVASLTAARNAEARLESRLAEQTAELRAEVEQRRRAERELIEVSVREHARMAQDLHDSLGQYVAAGLFQIRMLTEDLRLQQSPHTAKAERVALLVRKIGEHTRRIDQILRIPPAGPGGLRSAIDALAAEYQQLSGVRFKVDMDDHPVGLDDFRLLMLYRIVQEAFNNALKHGNPKSVCAELTVADRRLILRIMDDGLGVTAALDTISGTGLRTMGLRAELIGGARDGGGFVVEACVPLSALELGEEIASTDGAA